MLMIGKIKSRCSTATTEQAETPTALPPSTSTCTTHTSQASSGKSSLLEVLQSHFLNPEASGSPCPAAKLVQPKAAVLSSRDAGVEEFGMPKTIFSAKWEKRSPL